MAYFKRNVALIGGVKSFEYESRVKFRICKKTKTFKRMKRIFKKRMKS